MSICGERISAIPERVTVPEKTRVEEIWEGFVEENFPLEWRVDLTLEEAFSSPEHDRMSNCPILFATGSLRKAIIFSLMLIEEYYQRNKADENIHIRYYHKPIEIEDWLRKAVPNGDGTIKEEVLFLGWLGGHPCYAVTATGEGSEHDMPLLQATRKAASAERHVRDHTALVFSVDSTLIHEYKDQTTGKTTQRGLGKPRKEGGFSESFFGQNDELYQQYKAYIEEYIRLFNTSLLMHKTGIALLAFYGGMQTHSVADETTVWIPVSYDVSELIQKAGGDFTFDPDAAGGGIFNYLVRLTQEYDPEFVGPKDRLSLIALALGVPYKNIAGKVDHVDQFVRPLHFHKYAIDHEKKRAEGKRSRKT